MEKIEEIANQWFIGIPKKEKYEYSREDVIRLLTFFGIKLLSNPSEFGLVKQEEYDKLKQQADKLAEALRESNEMLRSCYSVVDREGQRTNWETLEARLKEILERQHKILYP